MSTGNIQKRRYPRFEVESVEGTVMFNLEAEVLNLSLAGMAIATQRSLEVGRIYSFTVRKGGEEVRMPGRVAWCRLRLTRHMSDTRIVPVYHAGIHFTDVLSSKAGSLLRLLEESVRLDVNRRIFGRFRPAGDASVTISSEVEFEVQKISLCGMLIDTALRAEQEDTFPMEISLPAGHVSCRGRVAYVQPRGGPGEPQRFYLGIEFLDLPERGRGILEQFIAQVVESMSEDQPPPPPAGEV